MPKFKGELVKLSTQEKEAIFHGGAIDDHPLDMDHLSLLRLSYYDFSGSVQSGELVVYSELSDEIIEIFNKIYNEKFPIESMLHIREFDQCDKCSMANNNTYGYCYRTITGTDRLSWHSFGLAIDINPRHNPFILGDTVFPADAEAFQIRSRVRPGMITPGSVVHTAFLEAGWEWGGDWTTIKDYHHFQKPLSTLEALRYGYDENAECPVCGTN